MKQYRKPTRNHKEMLMDKGFEPKEWRFVDEKQGVHEFFNPATGETIFLERK